MLIQPFSIRSVLSVFVAMLMCIAVLSISTPAQANPDVAPDVSSPEQILGLDRVNINQASAEELASVLKGVGLKKAQAIIEWRQANGAFTDPKQLLEVSGFGEKTLNINQNKIDL